MWETDDPDVLMAVGFYVQPSSDLREIELVSL